MNTAHELIQTLNLERHPEGGYYRETYRSDGRIDACCLGSIFDGSRSMSTAIYFLLEGKDISVFHRIRSDEIWHHYAGQSLCLHMIDEIGAYRTVHLGKSVDKAEAPQVIVPAGLWFGATVVGAASYALVGCTVSPGFDFRDLEIGSRDDLLRLYPKHRLVIEALTFK